MKQAFSIVIVCKNEAAVIGHLLDSAQNVTDDVVVYDNGSTDATVALAQRYKNVQLHQGPWQGFGKTKQLATALAKHDWVLSLDADEALDETLQHTLAQLSLDDPNIAYNIIRKINKSRCSRPVKCSNNRVSINIFCSVCTAADVRRNEVQIA